MSAGPAGVVGEDAPTWKRVERATAGLTTQVVLRMAELPYFEALPPQQRATVGLVVQAGLRAFAAWLRDPLSSPLPAPEVFAVAPRELARAVTLKQTVQLIRVAVGVIEDQVPALAAPGGRAALAEQVLRYSREVAFAAAEVYAAAAESRGAWDARLEAGVVDALVRGAVSELTLSRAASLGWQPGDWCRALATAVPARPDDTDLEALRSDARHRGWSLLSGEAGGGLLVILGGRGADTADGAVADVAALLPDGPVVVGPPAPDLAGCAVSVQEALAGLGAVAAWPAAPRPVPAAALLAERAVLGDDTARARLLEEVHRPLVTASGDLLRTVTAFLDGGSSVEGTARALFLHPNTVRYRLRKVVDTIGYDVAQPRDAQVVRVSLVLGRARSRVDQG